MSGRMCWHALMSRPAFSKAYCMEWDCSDSPRHAILRLGNLRVNGGVEAVIIGPGSGLGVGYKRVLAQHLDALVSRETCSKHVCKARQMDYKGRWLSSLIACFF